MQDDDQSDRIFLESKCDACMKINWKMCETVLWETRLSVASFGRIESLKAICRCFNSGAASCFGAVSARPRAAFGTLARLARRLACRLSKATCGPDSLTLLIASV